MMMLLVVLLLLVFRWPILKRFIGTVRMYLFDALMFTGFAAVNFAQPGSGNWRWLGFIVGGFCVYWAIDSGRKYLMYDAVQKEEDEQGKPDA